MLNTLSSVSMCESRIQYLCDPQWFRDTASRGPTTIVAPESQFRTCPSDHDSIGYPRMSASGESSTTMHRPIHASGSHPIPPPDDPNNQYNQDLGLIHSTNGNHLESPNEGSSIDHQKSSAVMKSLEHRRTAAATHEIRAKQPRNVAPSTTHGRAQRRAPSDHRRPPCSATSARHPAIERPIFVRHRAASARRSGRGDLRAPRAAHSSAHAAPNVAQPVRIKEGSGQPADFHGFTAGRGVDPAGNAPGGGYSLPVICSRYK
ncbi:heat stress transcription factor A-5-like [Dorcoceras hygrometricum]|uniref:Heat stress transcription factor A-5-like n=1 Tax=Dorcoceras hygrometricum TaxID=472368 RepID=A0A2Z7A6S3_9LAMI|nr:heat stress transcription factor A-5-like [Dorcoceras hygrometricum]